MSKSSLDIIKSPPRILVDPKSKLVLFWSAKAGSEFMMRWFFYHTNLLSQAENHHHFAHRYRQVIYKSDKYASSIRNYLNNRSDYISIKLVRNPYTRAVSSYIHCLNMLHRNNQHAIDLLTDSGKHSLRKAYSFSYFIDRLSEVDISKANIHWRHQVHNTEKKSIITIHHVIKLEHIEASIPRLEEHLNLKKTKHSALRPSTHNNTINPSQYEFVGNMEFDWTIRTNTPVYNNFYNNNLTNKVRLIYADDFETYSYSIAPLFVGT